MKKEARKYITNTRSINLWDSISIEAGIQAFGQAHTAMVLSVGSSPG
jgi:hypothetical protein